MPSECDLRPDPGSVDIHGDRDASDRINQLKAVKTSREIGLKLAHQVVQAGAQAFYQLAEAGIRDLATDALRCPQEGGLHGHCLCLLRDRITSGH